MIRVSFDGGIFIGRRHDPQWSFGVWLGGLGVRLPSGFYSLRPPWNRPLFSERNGYVRHLFRLWGWRLFVRALNPAPEDGSQTPLASSGEGSKREARGRPSPKAVEKQGPDHQ